MNHKQSNIHRQDSPKSAPDVCKQNFRFLCILDLEASINESDGKHEITELPLVLLSTTLPSLVIVDEFHTFVQPQRNKRQNESGLIPQERLTESPTFPEVWRDVLEFLDGHDVTKSNTLVVTCGDWDLRAMLPAEQKFHHIDRLELFVNWCNIKHAFKSFTGKKADSMVRMLNVTGHKLIGTHHSGIDDARNIATIARWLCQQGYVFQVTSDRSPDEQALKYQDKVQSEKAAANQIMEAARIAKLTAGATPPQELFRCDPKFSAWNEDGVPTALVDRTPISKSAMNKRKKIWKAQHLLHQKYLEWRESQL